MHQNLVWAVAYNAIAFPLAAGVLYPFVLSPEIAALSMSGSTLIVAINALMLKRLKLTSVKTESRVGALSKPEDPQLVKGESSIQAAPETVKKA